MRRLLAAKYANKRTVVEAMRSLMKLAQMSNEMPGELGVRAKELVDVYVEDLVNKCIGHKINRPQLGCHLLSLWQRIARAF